MNFRHYEALYWVGRLGSFHAAARHLRTSQAAISVRIRALEQQLGVTLFERGGEGARATAKGAELLAHAARLMALAADVQRVGSPASLSGRVRLGATGIHAATWVPGLLRQLAAETPDIAVELVIDTSETLHAMIDQARLEIAVLAGPVAAGRLTGEPLGSIPNVWVASPALGAPAACGVRELAGHAIISDRPGSLLHAAVLAWFRADGAEPLRHHGASNMQARLQLAQAGIGVALAPRAAALRLVRAGALGLVETPRPPPQLDYVLACADAGLFPAARRVADLVRRLVGSRQDFDAHFAAASLAG